MKRSRTNFLLLLFTFGANLKFVAPNSIKSEDTLGSTFHNRNVVQSIADITSVAKDDKDLLITYQPINQDSQVISDEDSRVYEITASGFDACANSKCLISSTFSPNSCVEETSPSLPAWKIDKGASEGKFRLKINQAKLLAQRTLFLCVSDEISGSFRHLGHDSRLYIDGYADF